MKLEPMEAFFSKGRASRERFPIVISTPCDGDEAVREFTAELDAADGFQQRRDLIHIDTQRLTPAFTNTARCMYV